MIAGDGRAAAGGAAPGRVGNLCISVIAGDGRAAAGGAAPGPAGGGPRHHQGHRRAGRPAPARGGSQAEEPTHSHGHPPSLPHGQILSR
jgi:hypothetical protein